MVGKRKFGLFFAARLVACQRNNNVLTLQALRVVIKFLLVILKLYKSNW